MRHLSSITPAPASPRPPMAGRVIGATIALAVVLASFIGFAAPADAAYTGASCFLSSRGRDVSLCVQGRYKHADGRACPNFKQLLIGVGSGGRALEEGVGVIARDAVWRNYRGTVVYARHGDFALAEHQEDRYRRILDPLTSMRTPYLKVSVVATLRIDHGRDRDIAFTRTITAEPC